MKGQIVRRLEVNETTRTDMFDLFSSQFENVSRQQFASDLNEKDWVLLLSDDAGKLTGFSSLNLYDVTIGDRRLSIVYSGDTVVDSHAWRDSALSYYWMGAVDYLKRAHDIDCLYWFLLVSGYRTYRFLPVYSRVFYPRFDQPTPRAVQRIMDALARQRFGGQYDASAGIVRLRAPSILKDGYRGIPDHRLGDPHVAFFAERNPGHEQGDELVCLAELSERKLTRLGLRMWQKGSRLFRKQART